jgi:signal transduction histidine kinase
MRTAENCIAGVALVRSCGSMGGCRGLGRACVDGGHSVSEERQIVAALEARVVALERDLQEVTSVASHDLMEPARTIAGFLELIRESCGDRLQGEEKDFLQFTLDAAARLRRMLAALLELSRVNTHGNAFATVDLNEVLVLALDRSRHQLEAVAGEVTHDELPAVMGDEMQLLRVFSALIENALAFAGDRPPQVHVEGTVDQVNGTPMATLSIRDCGIGIAPKFHEAVFELFRRLHPRTRTSGIGAGLAICRRILERHGGRIWVDSVAGEGSAFHVSLPAASTGYMT